MQQGPGIRNICCIRIPNVGAFALLFWLMGTAVAWAEPQLEASFPVAGTTVTEPPEELILQFDEPVEQAEGTRYSLMQETGEEHTIEARVLTDAPSREIRVPLPTLEPGRYEFRWHIVTGEEGELLGSLEFTLR